MKKSCRQEKNIYCISLFAECINQTVPDAEASVIKSDFFKFFFREWLPYNICQEDDDVIESIYPQIKGFCRYADRNFGTNLVNAFGGVSGEAAETKRMLYVKKSIMRFIKSPVLSKKPEVIDLNCYRARSERAKRLNQTYLPERGYFKVIDIFTNYSIVLKKISGYTFFIRVYLDEPVINKIRPGDVLDIKVRPAETMTGWLIEDILGCMAREEIC